MSDVMLHGVLCMPPELWDGSDIDKRQRYSRYLQASRRIEDDGRKIELLSAALTAIADQGPHYGPDGTTKTWIHWQDLARRALAPNADSSAERRLKRRAEKLS